MPPVGRSRSPTRNARRRAREFALQGLYEWLLSGDGSPKNAIDIETHIRETRGFERADSEHFAALLQGAIAESGQLRQCFAPFLDRRVDELSPVEHGVLLIGAFELAHRPDIPYKVVINESVELAKSFGGTDGFRYVNGVLDKVAATLRQAEVTASRSN